MGEYLDYEIENKEMKEQIQMLTFKEIEVEKMMYGITQQVDEEVRDAIEVLVRLNWQLMESKVNIQN